MPRCNLWTLLILCLVSGLCHLQTDQPPYARYFDHALSHASTEALDPVDPRRLYEAAMEGMLAELDPYTGYSPPQEARELDEEINQELTGIGVRIDWDPAGRPRVLSPMRGGPAAEVGIHSGDRILSVDGLSTLKLPQDELFSRVRGPAGSVVRLELERPQPGQGEPKTWTVSVTRRAVRIESVLGDLPTANGGWHFQLEGEPEVTYLRVREFGQFTAQEIADVLRPLEQAKSGGVILDLRGNVGGLLQSACETCDLFIEPGKLVVSRKNREGKVLETRLALDAGFRYQGPLVVLIDGGTASASEIVAGCLQDHSRAKILGNRSYGKGTVQDIIEIERGRALLRLTTSGFWRPSGRNIHRRKDATLEDVWGILPDPGLEVPHNDEAWKELDALRNRRDFPVLAEQGAVSWSEFLTRDHVLQKAIEVLKQSQAVATQAATK